MLYIVDIIVNGLHNLGEFRSFSPILKYLFRNRVECNNMLEVLTI